MIVTLNTNTCVIQLEEKEKVRNEADLYFQIAKKLKALKRLADHEGLMISNTHVVTDHKRTFYIYDHRFAERDAAKDLNFHREITFNVHRG